MVIMTRFSSTLFIQHLAPTRSFLGALQNPNRSLPLTGGNLEGTHLLMAKGETGQEVERDRRVEHK